MIRNDLQSRTIDALRLVLILCVVLVHAYTSTRGDINTDQFPVYRFVSFFISLNIAQIAIPGFFFISGYLYFNTTRSYTQHIRHDWWRLTVPYLLWNGLMIAAYWLLECVPGFGGFFSGDNVPIHQYGITNFLRAFWDSGHWSDGNGTPILHQFWYIRNLLLLGLISPLIRLYIRWTGVVGLAALLIWWIFTPGQAMIAKSLAFFTFGAWFSIWGKDFLPPFRKHIRTVSVLFITFATLVMCFWDYSWAAWLNRLNDILGLVFFTGITAWALERQKNTYSLSYLQGLTFFIYAAHDPMIILIKRTLMRLTTPPTDASLTMDYFLSAIAVIVICTGVYFLMKRFCPKLLSLLVGARSPKKHRHDQRTLHGLSRDLRA